MAADGDGVWMSNASGAENFAFGILLSLPLCRGRGNCRAEFMRGPISNNGIIHHQTMAGPEH